MMSGTMARGRDAKARSWVRRTASAARGEETTRVGTEPRWTSMRPSRPCLAARSRRETCGREPTRCMWPITGSLSGGEGSLLRRSSLLRSPAIVVARAKRRSSSRSATGRSKNTAAACALLAVNGSVLLSSIANCFID
ncbi:Os08g0105901 [Oryza sativa Japonica Group]|uniref:Os08g0105901 protein n=1 Tax=Oryza sativa subsp. japonica TaxID=39947 RepID=A0A0N7KP52_ORYSJ|nr:Os08g0105901 [Oryza sativa Japonica Group]